MRVTLQNPNPSSANPPTMTLEAGRYVDGSHCNFYDATIRLVKFTNTLLSDLDVTREIVPPSNTEDDSETEDCIAASDECEEALNAVTPDGWSWFLEQGDLFLVPSDEDDQ